MKLKTKNIGLYVVLGMALLLCAVLLVSRSIKAGRADAPPAELQPDDWIEVQNGPDSTMLIQYKDNLNINPMSPEDFSADENGEPVYNGEHYRTIKGIDVSAFQLNIDWEAVRDSGIDFAIIRIGGRGYAPGEAGTVYEDTAFEKNLSEAKDAGLKVGVYFFSQAVSPAEAREEAAFVLDALDGRKLDLPVYFDWEFVHYGSTARTDNMDGKTLTECAEAFCKAVSDAGYKPGVYFNQELGYTMYNLGRLDFCDFWFARPDSLSPYFYYEMGMWQYNWQGDVPGIDQICDLNYRFEKAG